LDEVLERWLAHRQDARILTNPQVWLLLFKNGGPGIASARTTARSLPGERERVDDGGRGFGSDLRVSSIPRVSERSISARWLLLCDRSRVSTRRS
jgi:hypothetical protein